MMRTNPLLASIWRMKHLSVMPVIAAIHKSYAAFVVTTATTVLDASKPGQLAFSALLSVGADLSSLATLARKEVEV